MSFHIGNGMAATAMAILLTGCVTPTWVTKEVAPTKGGIIKYADGSIIPSVNADRRADAMAEIAGYCRGGAKIIGEDILAEGRQGTHYRYVNFNCTGGGE